MLCELSQHQAGEMTCSLRIDSASGRKRPPARCFFKCGGIDARGFSAFMCAASVTANCRELDAVKFVANRQSHAGARSFALPENVEAIASQDDN